MLFFGILIAILSSTLGINVIVFMPGTTDQEREPLMRIAQYLAFKNHGLCTFKGIIIPEVKYLVMPRLHLARELKLKTGVPEELYRPMKELGNHAPWLPGYDNIEHARPVWRAYANACEAILNSDLMQRITTDKYDVALVYAGQPCHLAIANMVRVPYIYYDMNGLSDEIVFASNSPSMPWIMPSSDSTYPQDMSWTQRWHNLWLQFLNYAPHTNVTWLMNLSERYRVLDKHVSDLFKNDYELKKIHPYIPNVNEMKEEAALYFVNSDPLLEFPGRVVAPNVIYVGGSHMPYPKELYEPWNVSMAAAKSGVIICSFGHVVNASAMPALMLKAFMDTFRRFPDYRIYFKTASMVLPGYEELEDVPDNVNATQFIPQLDMMNTGMVKLLITHGGMNSIMEALYTGVPILGIPMFGVHYNNLRKVEERGFGKILDKNDITADSLHAAITELLESKKYHTMAKELSRQYKDRPMGPFESLIYWIEYVAKHHGAAHYQSKGSRGLYWLRYQMVDVLAVLAVLAMLVFFTLYHLVRFVYRKLKQMCCATKATPAKSHANGHSSNGTVKNGHANGNGPVSNGNSPVDNAASKKKPKSTKGE